MAEPPASGCATRAARFGASFVGVASGSLLLLLEELDCCAFEGTALPLRTIKAVRHRKSPGFRRDDDLARKDTIGIRRSPEV